MEYPFIEGQAYKLKLTFRKTKMTMFYNGIRQEVGEEPAYHFSQHVHKCGNNLWLLDKHIETAEDAVPTKPKARKLQTCNRCFGAGRFEHVAHVQGGICFKCNGTGQI